MKGGQNKWSAVTLGEVCEFKYGKSLPESARAGGEVPVYGSNGEVGRHCEALTDGPTIVIGRKGSYGEINYSLVSCWPIDTTYYVDHTSTKADLRWLAYRLSALGLNKLNKAAAVPGLNREDAYRQRLLLPPLPEQRRIAEILDKSDALRAKRRAALAQLDTLTQSIFLDMFGDPATNPKGWPVRTIGDVTECLDRLRRPVTESDRIEGSVPYYGANGQQGWIDSAIFDEPLVLVAEDGGYFDAPERGVAYRIDGPAWVNNHAHILRALAPHVTTEFLHRALRHFNFMPFISGTTRAKLTQGQMNAVKLFIPPSSLQNDFGGRVAAVEKLKTSTAAVLAESDSLFASLQHRAFRGEL